MKIYIQEIKKYLDLIDEKSVSDSIDLINNTAKKGNIIYIIGNGGSLAISMHLAEDLMLCNKLKIKSIALSNPAALTAASNDNGYENSFLLQLKNLLKKEDLLVAISASGNSENIIRSIKYARKIGTPIIGFSGFDGGRMKGRCTINFHIQTKFKEYEMTEDIFSIICHIISRNFRKLYDKEPEELSRIPKNGYKLVHKRHTNKIHADNLMKEIHRLYG